MPANEFQLPYEYRFIKLEGLATEPPPDLCQRTLIFLDCGNIDRRAIEGCDIDRRAIDHGDCLDGAHSGAPLLVGRPASAQSSATKLTATSTGAQNISQETLNCTR